MRPVPFLLLVTLVGTMPAAVAHGGAHSEVVSQGISYEMDPFISYLDPDPATPYANASNQAFRLQALRADLGGYAQPRAWLDLTGPQGWHVNLSFNPVDTRYMIVSTTLPHAGAYAAKLVLEHDGELLALSQKLDVYPDPGFRIAAIDPSAEVIPDARTVLAYETVDPLTLTRVDRVDDLTVRIEEASADHKTVLSTADVPLTRQGTGVWRAEHVFPEGHFFLRFASRSAGLNYSDTPLIHIESAPALAAPAVTEPTPLPWGIAAFALVVGALASARRR